MAKIPNIRNIFSKLRVRLGERVLLGPLEDYVVAVQKLAIEKAPTTRIKNNIFITSPEQTKDGIVASIIVDISEKGAPEGRAYELGSGLHGEFGETYLIVPVKGTFLAFEWEKADPSIPTLDDGRVLLKSVDHPGVEARPYIGPAIDEADRGVITGLIAKALRFEIATIFSEESGG